MARGPTAKQRMFADALFGRAKGNQTLAARMAGYGGNDAVLSVQGSRNMKNPNVQQLIEEKFKPMLEGSLEVYAQALSATTRKAFMTRQGEVKYSNPEPYWKVKMDAANRVLKHFEQPLVHEEPSREPDVAKNEDNAELQHEISSLSAADRTLIARTCVVEQRLADVDRQLSEDADEPGHENKS